MEIAIGVLAFLVAAWQLHLQRQEIRRNGKINTLVHMATLIKDRIDLYKTIIESQKQKNEQWHGHAKVVNEKLRPLLDKINKDLIAITSDYRCSFDPSEVEKVLKLQSDEGQVG
jgi:hypothetical protein